MLMPKKVKYRKQMRGRRNGKAWRGGSTAGQAIIVIVALPDLQLLIRIFHPGADGMRGTEIERRCIDLLRRAKRNAAGTYRQIAIRRDRQTVVENSAIGLDAGKVEETVVGQIDDGRLVGHRNHFHRKLGAA